MSPAARHRCDVSLELCCPGAKSRRWAPPDVTRFGVIPQVQWRFDFFMMLITGDYQFIITCTNNGLVAVIKADLLKSSLALLKIT